MTTPDLDEARRFLRLLDPDTDVFTFQTFDDGEAKRDALARIKHGTLDELAEELIALQKAGAGIFVTVNETDLDGRETKNIKRVRASFTDLDGAPLQPVLDCPLKPHVVVESSPGKYHAYWFAHRMPLDQFRPVQKALAARFKGDRKVIDLPRVMRLPGFVHQKAEPFRTRILQAEVDRPPYEATDIIAEAGVQDGPSPNGEDGHASTGDGEDRATAELIRALLGGEDFHATLLALAMRYAKAGMPDGQIIVTLKGMMTAVPAENRGTDSRWLARYNEIPRLVRSAREKVAADEQPVSLDYELLCDIKPNLTSNYIVKGMMDRRAFGEVHSDRSAGKTAILIDMLLHVAACLEYRGRRVVQQPVVYVALEGHSGIGNRVFAAKQQLGIIDAPFALVRAAGDFRDPETAKKVADIARRLMATFGGDCPVIAIDTFTAALGAGTSDCDPKDVTKFIANVQQHLLAICTVIIAHHFGKDSSRGGRGWSGLGAALDFELEIDRDGDLRTMRVTKSRDGSDCQPAFCYNFAGREIGIDEDGDSVTAVVVEHLADEAAAPQRGKRHSPKARAALNILWEMIKDGSRSFPLSEQPGLRCVILADWEVACIAPSGISKCHEERDRRKQFRAAKAELEAANSIVCDSTAGGRVYPAPKDPRE